MHSSQGARELIDQHRRARYHGQELPMHFPADMGNPFFPFKRFFSISLLGFPWLISLLAWKISQSSPHPSQWQCAPAAHGACSRAVLCASLQPGVEYAHCGKTCSAASLYLSQMFSLTSTARMTHSHRGNWPSRIKHSCGSFFSPR